MLVSGMRTTPEQIQDIIELCNYINEPFICLELGSYAGESAELFLNHINCKHIICVDPWDLPGYTSNQSAMLEAEKSFDERVSKFNNKVTKIKNFGINTYDDLLNTKIDLVYIDADHEYSSVLKDIYCWMKRTDIKWIGGHDYNNDGYTWNDGVIKAVDEVFGSPDKVFCGYSWIKRIN